MFQQVHHFPITQFITSYDRTFGCPIMCNDNAIMFTDSSNNTWYNQVHWLIGAPYLSIIASNGLGHILSVWVTSYTLTIGYFTQNRKLIFAYLYHSFSVYKRYVILYYLFDNRYPCKDLSNVIDKWSSAPLWYQLTRTVKYFLVTERKAHNTYLLRYVEIKRWNNLNVENLVNIANYFILSRTKITDLWSTKHKVYVIEISFQYKKYNTIWFS